MRRAVGSPLIVGLIVIVAAAGAAVALGTPDLFDDPSPWETFQLASGWLSGACVVGVVLLPFTRTHRDDS